MLLLLLIVGAICALVYFYVKKCNNYWTERGIKTVETNFFFGTSFDLLTGRRSLEQIHEDVYQRAEPDEPYVGIYNLLKPGLFVRDPEFIHQITVKDFNYFHDRLKTTSAGGPLVHSVVALGGEEWRIMRNQLNTPFSSAKVKTMYGMIEECCEVLVEQHFRPSIEAGEPVDIKEAMSQFALEVIGKCAFGLQFKSLKAESDSLYRKVVKSLKDPGLMDTFRIILPQLINPTLLEYLGVKITSDEVENFIFDVLRKVEELRTRGAEHRGDFLQLMLDIRDQEDNGAKHLFTENHIASNMFAFYLAGYGTISNATAFALYELAMQPDIQEKLRREIKKTREDNGSVLNYDSVNDMPYLEMIVSETLRLHGSAPFGSRFCTQTYQVPGSSLTIEVGEQLFYSISAIHKDEKYFPDPLKFDPERFSRSNKLRMNPFAYQPFGSGPRMCLGSRFAKLEMKICLVSILSRFKLSRCDKTETPIILKKSSFFNAAENGIWLMMEEIPC